MAEFKEIRNISADAEYYVQSELDSITVDYFDTEPVTPDIMDRILQIDYSSDPQTYEKIKKLI